MSLSIRIYFIIILCFSALAYPVVAADNNYMPKGLRNIRLGMTEKDFKLARPHAAVPAIGEPISENDMRLYFETIPELTFLGNEITYGFFKGKLSMINMQDINTLDKCKMRRKQIIKGAMRKWGSYSVNYTKTSREPDLAWKVGEIEMHLLFNPSCRYYKSPYNGDCDKYSMILVIFDSKKLPSSDAAELNAYVPATVDEINLIKSELNNSTEPPYFE